MIELALACFAVVIAAVALARSYVPPQSRRVMELTADVADLQQAVDEFGRRLTGWNRTEGMVAARSALKTRRAAHDAILTDAMAVIEATKAAPPAAAAPLTKAALRAQFGIVR